MRSSITYSTWRLLLVSLGCVLAEQTFAAADLDFAAAVSPSIFYTDNLCLTANNKKDSLDLGLNSIGLVTPSASFSSQGSRASFNIDGSVQFNALTNSKLDRECNEGFNADRFNGGEREQFAPNIYATGSGILIEDWVTVTGSATANQNQVSPFIGGGTDPLNRNGNTNTYYLYSISPVISRRIRDTASYSVRYTRSEVINSQDVVNDSTSNAVAANLSNDTSSKLSWGLLGNYRRVEYSESDFVNVFTGQLVPRQDTELKSVGLQLGYQIDRRWQVNGRTGWEWNDFQQYYKTGADTGGSIWDIGVRWTPTQRTTASLGMTSRFFGTAPRLNISHTRKRSHFTASYNKSITFANDIRTQQDLLNPDYINNYALNSNSPVLDERFTLGYSYTGRRATINLSGSNSQQTQADNGEESTFQGLALSVRPQFSRVYSLSGTVAWNDSESDSIFGVPNSRFRGNSEYWITSVSVGRPISSRTSMSFNYRYTDQTSNDSFGGYTENRIMATVNIRL